MDYKINKETASEMFDAWCEAWEIDNDLTMMDDDDKAGFENQKRIFVKAVMKGRLVLNEDDTLNYTFSEKSLKSGEQIKIKMPTGASYMDMDGYKDSQTIRKTYAVLASMTGQPVKYFSNVSGIDLKPLQAVIALFLAG